MKVCYTCKTEKSPEDFPRDKHRKDGLSYYCKACWADRKASYTVRRKVRIATVIRLAITTRDDSGDCSTQVVTEGRSIVTDPDFVTILDRYKRPLLKFKPSQLVAMAKLCCSRPPWCAKCTAIIRNQEEKSKRPKKMSLDSPNLADLRLTIHPNGDRSPETN